MIPHFEDASLDAAVEGSALSGDGNYQNSAISSSREITPKCVVINIFPPRTPDPFFRALDVSIRTEHAIRQRAIELLQILHTEPWKFCSPFAQDVERASACRTIRESLEREAADLADAMALVGGK